MGLGTSKRSLRCAFAALAFFTLSGFTDCGSFSQVTVPASDSSAPFWFSGIWRSQAFRHSTVNGNLNVTLSSFGEQVALVGSGLDNGGMMRLRVTYNRRVSCCNAQGLCKKVLLEDTQVYEDSQSGGTGSRVSNGIYGAQLFSPQDSVFALCRGAGFEGFRTDRSSVTARWQIEAWDFANNRTTSGWSRATYPGR